MNRAATAGLTLGIIPLLAVPVTFLLGTVLRWGAPSVFMFTLTLYYIAPFMFLLGLVNSCVGLSTAKAHERAGFGPVGRSKAITGVVLFLLGLALLTTYVARALYCMSGPMGGLGRC